MVRGFIVSIYQISINICMPNKHLLGAFHTPWNMLMSPSPVQVPCMRGVGEWEMFIKCLHVPGPVLRIQLTPRKVNSQVQGHTISLCRGRTHTSLRAHSKSQGTLHSWPCCLTASLGEVGAVSPRGLCLTCLTVPLPEKHPWYFEPKHRPFEVFCTILSYFILTAFKYMYFKDFLYNLYT